MPRRPIYIPPRREHPIRSPEISPPGKSPIERLPAELLLEITSYLKNDYHYHYVAILSLASRVLREILGDDILNLIPKDAGDETRDKFLSLLTKDSVIYYQCITTADFHLVTQRPQLNGQKPACSKTHPYSSLFITNHFANGLITPFSHRSTNADKERTILPCAERIGVMDYMSNVFMHTMPFLYVDYLRAEKRWGHKELEPALFPRSNDLYYSEKWDALWPEETQSASTHYKLDTAMRWGTKGLIVSCKFTFADSCSVRGFGDENFLPSSHRMIICPHISSVEMDDPPVHHHASFSTTPTFRNHIEETCAFLSWNNSSDLLGRASVYHTPKLGKCYYCTTEYEISAPSPVTGNEVVVTVWREFGFSTANAYASRLGDWRTSRKFELRTRKIGDIKRRFERGAEKWNERLEEAFDEFEEWKWGGRYEIPGEPENETFSSSSSSSDKDEDEGREYGVNDGYRKKAQSDKYESAHSVKDYKFEKDYYERSGLLGHYTDSDEIYGDEDRIGNIDEETEEWWHRPAEKSKRGEHLFGPVYEGVYEDESEQFEEVLRKDFEIGYELGEYVGSKEDHAAIVDRDDAGMDLGVEDEYDGVDS